MLGGGVLLAMDATEKGSADGQSDHNTHGADRQHSKAS